MVLADHVYQDRVSGKFIIAGTFSQITFGSREPSTNPEAAGKPQMASGPITVAGSPYLYLALVEVYGQVSLALKFVDLSDASILFEGQLGLTSLDPLAVAEYIVAVPPLPATKVGSYSLDLLHEGEILGSWRILVKQAEDRPPS